MTLTQLSAFVLVVRLGTVKAAAAALGVSEPAVSQAITALRRHFGDQLLVRGENGMVPTAAGSRLLGVAAQMVALGTEAEAAVRSAQGAAEVVRLIGPSDVVEFVGGPLAEAFSARSGRRVEVTAGVAGVAEMAVLVSHRLADLALGPVPVEDRSLRLVSEPVFRGRLVVLAAERPCGAPSAWPWLVDPAGADPEGEVGRLLARLAVPESRMQVFPNQTAAWEAAARGAGVAPGMAHLAAPRLRRGELQVVQVPGTPLPVVWHATTLPPDRRAPATGSLRRYLSTPEAMTLLGSPGAGVPPSRFRPPVHVTIWS
ncbi:DNA-binding transcriptional regulator, LysR family [Pseudonocardia ammonioxydans]|uniref:DNA-binding transcriptional regulator, LysR family n=1 Tax=Pseudonocardia ammonioxydans TaxID=260086 RepID=A0A1I5D7J3_PSUAM|nr:LysR family transcriptional regulator [Pseudonocardia ammonioxydans]SFN95244.1 DNA-binding transcriptional regulator, LysR family [Pseudonocardia ammonioxydans]